MKDKLEILYPRNRAQIHIYQDSCEEDIYRKIELIDMEYSEVFERYNRLKARLSEIKDSRTRFTCWGCSKEFLTKDLTLYRFVSCANNMDETIYEDENIICPSCGRFSFYRKDNVPSKFKEVKEIYE